MGSGSTVHLHKKYESGPYRNKEIKSLKYDAFFSHDWGIDKRGRSTLARVRRVCEYLRNHNLLVWFDEATISKSRDLDISLNIPDLLQSSECVVVFLTEGYIFRINSERNNECKIQYTEIMRQKYLSAIVPVVLDDISDFSACKLLCKTMVDMREFEVVESQRRCFLETVELTLKSCRIKSRRKIEPTNYGAIFAWEVFFKTKLAVSSEISMFYAQLLYAEGYLTTQSLYRQLQLDPNKLADFGISSNDLLLLFKLLNSEVKQTLELDAQLSISATLEQERLRDKEYTRKETLLWENERIAVRERKETIYMKAEDQLSYDLREASRPQRPRLLAAPIIAVVPPERSLQERLRHEYDRLQNRLAGVDSINSLPELMQALHDTVNTILHRQHVDSIKRTAMDLSPSLPREANDVGDRDRDHDDDAESLKLIQISHWLLEIEALMTVLVRVATAAGLSFPDEFRSVGGIQLVASIIAYTYSQYSLVATREIPMVMESSQTEAAINHQAGNNELRHSPKALLPADQGQRARSPHKVGALLSSLAALQCLCECTDGDYTCNSKNASLLTKLAIPELVLPMLAKHKAKKSLVRECVACVAALAGSGLADSSQALVFADKSVVSVGGLIEEAPTNNPRVALRSLDAIQWLLWAMERFNADAAIVTWGCRALVHLLGLAEFKPRRMDNSVYEVMKATIVGDTLPAECGGTIVCCPFDNIVHILLLSLHSHADDANVLAWALSIFVKGVFLYTLSAQRLKFTSRQDTLVCSTLAKTLSSKGILKSSSAFAYDKPIERATNEISRDGRVGIAAPSAGTSSDSERWRNLPFWWRRNKFVVLIKTSLRDYSSDAHVAEATFLLLGNVLATFPDSVNDFLADKGFYSAFLAALWNHSENLVILSHGFYAMENLLNVHTNSQRVVIELVQHGAVDRIMSALLHHGPSRSVDRLTGWEDADGDCNSSSTHKEYSRIHEDFCICTMRLLSCLLSELVPAPVVLDDGVTRRDHDHEENGLQVLRAVRDRIVSISLCEKLVPILASISVYGESFAFGCAAISSLAAFDEEMLHTKRRLGCTGITKVLVKGMKMHRTQRSGSIFNLICKAVLDLCLDYPDNVTRFAEGGVAALLPCYAGAPGILDTPAGIAAGNEAYPRSSIRSRDDGKDDISSFGVTISEFVSSAGVPTLQQIQSWQRPRCRFGMSGGRFRVSAKLGTGFQIPHLSNAETNYVFGMLRSLF